MRTRRSFASLLAAALAGCGGGLYLEFGDGDLGPPSVSLAAPAGPVRAGSALHVVAAAADENGIDEVALYRIEPGGAAVFVAADTAAPYEFDLVVPSDGRATLELFARATDGAGSRADSDAVRLVVTP